MPDFIAIYKSENEEGIEEILILKQNSDGTVEKIEYVEEESFDPIPESLKSQEKRIIIEEGWNLPRYYRRIENA